MPHEPIPPFQVALSWEGVVVTATVTGEVDCATAPALAKRLLEVAAARPERLVLDLDRLFFTDVASARALDSACKTLEQQFPVIVRASPRPSSARRSSASPGL
jgi:anti-anti-sigma factor